MRQSQWRAGCLCFDSATEQKNQGLALECVVDAVAWAVVDLELVDAIFERAKLTGIPEGKASDTNLNFCLGITVTQAAKPAVERAALEDFVHAG